MKKEICTCSCHQNPLLFHFNNCCEHTGKLYINEDGTIDLEKYNKVLGIEKKDLCPCCGGTGENQSR